MEDKNFYRAFEEKYRGSRELIKSRLEVYLPFIMPLKKIYDQCVTLDLGCGRGEWLELLMVHGFQARGIDLDDGMLKACSERMLNAIHKDALGALKDMPDESLVVVSGFHIAEHLSFEMLFEIINESRRVLKPGGILILETPNTENIRVGTSYFYHDPTHVRPIPMLTLSFLTEYNHFIRNKILRLQESEELRNCLSPTIYDVYCGASQDYGVVAQKTAPLNVLLNFDDVFAKEYGLSVETLCKRYEANITSHFVNIEADLKDLQSKTQNAEAVAKNAETIARNAAMALNNIYASRSWKMTAPYRAIGDFLRKIKHILKIAIKSFLKKAISYIIRHPRLKAFVVSKLQKFPKIEARLNCFYNVNKASIIVQDPESNPPMFYPFTHRSHQIYNALLNSVKSSEAHK